MPPAPGAPVVYQLPQGSGFVAGATADGNGLLYLSYLDVDELGLHVVRPDGSLAAFNVLFGAFPMQFVPQLSGALTYRQLEGSGGFARVDPDAGVTGFSPGYVTTATMVNDPTGGAVAGIFGSSSTDPNNGLWAFDAQGQVRWTLPSPTPGNLYSPAGVDRQGNVLVVFKDPGANALRAFWVDPSGKAQPQFDFMTSEQLAAAGYASSIPPMLFEPRVGAGLFVRFGSLDQGQVPTWVGSIDSLATHVDAAPAWLQARPGTRLHMVHGGTGYAVLTETAPGAQTACTQSVEVVSAQGTSCGTMNFALPAATCALEPLVIGYDGTLIQTYPHEAESCAQPGSYTCTVTWRFWPGLFR